LFFLPQVANAKIVDSNCIECHTDSAIADPDGFLWGVDCVTCHALGLDERIVVLPGGTLVPQVYHTDYRGDLAGGNFAYISGSKVGVGLEGSRKGHDVIDLFPGGDDILIYPPGFIHGENPINFKYRLSCAGANGCHGVRNQLMEDSTGKLVPRIGMSALQGAHHANEDGPLRVADTVANSYRFLMGVRGLENPYPQDPWQNVTPAIHNEYYGEPYRVGDERHRHCSKCHYGSTQATTYSYITAPRNSMSGFCITCHSNFHARQRPGTTAFLRHPSDFVIPDKGEYGQYIFYDLTAPVARPWVYEMPSDLVYPGKDMVMCLSCHMAHASPYDGLLRFDFTRMVAGNADPSVGAGCFACHTSKGGRR
jgi:hypothetical protein